MDEFRTLGEAKHEYRLVEGEDEMLRLPNEGWSIEREVNHGKYLMKQ